MSTFESQRHSAPARVCPGQEERAARVEQGWQQIRAALLERAQELARAGDESGSKQVASLLRDLEVEVRRHAIRAGIFEPDKA